MPALALMLRPLSPVPAGDTVVGAVVAVAVAVRATAVVLTGEVVVAVAVDADGVSAVLLSPPVLPMTSSLWLSRLLPRLP